MLQLFQDVLDLPPRDYSSTRDPFVSAFQSHDLAFVLAAFFKSMTNREFTALLARAEGAC